MAGVAVVHRTAIMLCRRNAGDLSALRSAGNYIVAITTSDRIMVAMCKHGPKNVPRLRRAVIGSDNVAYVARA